MQVMALTFGAHVYFCQGENLGDFQHIILPGFGRNQPGIHKSMSGIRRKKQISEWIFEGKSIAA